MKTCCNTKTNLRKKAGSARKHGDAALRLEGRSGRRCLPGMPGSLWALPLLVEERLLELMSARDLSQLACTSKSMIAVLLEWVKSQKGVKHLMPSVPSKELAQHNQRISGQLFIYLHETDFRTQSHDVGVLLKNITVFLTPCQRMDCCIKFIKMMFNQLKNLCEADKYYVAGQILHPVLTVIPTSYKYQAIVKVVKMVSGNGEIMDNVVNTVPGVLKAQEVQLRRVIRCAILDPCEQTCVRNALLLAILQQYEDDQIAKLIYVLYGPSTQAEISWTKLDKHPDGRVVVDSLDTYMALRSLAGCLHMFENRGQSVSILVKMFEGDRAARRKLHQGYRFRSKWDYKHIGDLLYQCDSKITHEFINTVLRHQGYSVMAPVVLHLATFASVGRGHVLLNNSTSTSHITLDDLVTELHKIYTHMTNFREYTATLLYYAALISERILDNQELSPEERVERNRTFFSTVCRMLTPLERFIT